MKQVFALVFIMIAGRVFAQPVVPERMQFANIKLKINEGAKKEIQKDVDALTKNPTYFEAKVERARMYFPIIERIFKEEGISDDFKYLVIQESGLVSDAVSVSDAVGFWQFKEFTAIEMGLRVDRYIDERMNIVSSSHAAAKYFKKNNFYFNNWLYALQAYQMGAGGVLESENSKYFGAKSMTIGKNTYWYIKKYLAHRIAYEYALDQKRNSQKELLEFTRGKGKDLHDISKELMVDQNEVLDYNKWLRKGKIPGDKVYTVIIPIKSGVKGEIVASDNLISEKIDEPVAILDPTYEGREDPGAFPVISDGKSSFLKNPAYVKVNGIPGIIGRKGMNISIVSGEAGIGEVNFRKYNEMLPHQEIEDGQVYYFKSKKGKAKVHYHTLMPGENLWMISQKYGVKLSKLLKKNRLKSDNGIKDGMVVWLRYIRPANEPVSYKEIEPVVIDGLPGKIPAMKFSPEVGNHESTEPGLVTKESAMPEESAEITKTQIIQHEVLPKETLYSISKQYNVTVMDVVESNDLKLTETLNSGRIINIKVFADYQANLANNPIGFKESSHAADKMELPATSDIYIVKAGDTLYNIASRFGITVDKLQELNHLVDEHLAIGEKLLISSK